jgi:transposase
MLTGMTLKIPPISQKTKKREFVLRELNAQRITAADAALTLGLCERQVRRLLAAYRQEGAEAVIHGNRGRTPANVLSPELRQTIVELAQTRYQGFNQSHLTEKLAEEQGIVVSRTSVRRVLGEAGIRSPRRHRRAQHRSRRERRPCAGMLLQLDGSRHDWLQGRGPALSLLAAIDDATGEVVAALFRADEDAHGYMLLLHNIAHSHGLPLAVYSDRHSIFVVPAAERETLDEQLAGCRAPTQVGRLLQDLGIELIIAQSPQAKGRIERLWDTLQDRLVNELRLARASSLPEANAALAAYLPLHNAKFMRTSREVASAYRPIPVSLNLETVFSFQYERTVANDNTVRLGPSVVQIPPNHERTSYAKAKTRICIGLDGSISVLYKGHRIAYQPCSDPDIVLRAQKQRR